MFKIDDAVRSIAVGTRDAFDGVIAEIVIKSGSAGNTRGEEAKSKLPPKIYYHVRDEHGSLWHRTDKELTLVGPQS